MSKFKVYASLLLLLILGIGLVLILMSRAIYYDNHV